MSQPIDSPEGDLVFPLPPDTDKPHLAEAIAAAQRLAAYCREFGYACAAVTPDNTLRLLRSVPLRPGGEKL